MENSYLNVEIPSGIGRENSIAAMLNRKVSHVLVRDIFMGMIPLILLSSKTHLDSFD